METYKEARTVSTFTAEQRADMAAEAIMSGLDDVDNEDAFLDLYDDVSIEFVYSNEREWIERTTETRGNDLAKFQTLVNVALRSRGFDSYDLVDSETI